MGHSPSRFSESSISLGASITPFGLGGSSFAGVVVLMRNEKKIMFGYPN